MRLSKKSNDFLSEAVPTFVILILGLLTPALLHAQQIPEDIQWSQQFGGAVGFNDSVSKTIPVGDSLIAIGSFLRVSDEITEEIALWDGQLWRSMKGGVCDYQGLRRGIPRCDFYTAYMQNNTIFALARVHLEEDQFGRLALLRWDGTSWLKEYQWADNRSGIAYDALLDGDSVYITGDFISVLEDSTIQRLEGIIRWDGQTWEPIGEISGRLASRMVKAGNELYVIGDFSFINGIDAQNIARWDGNEWRSLANVSFDPRNEDINDIAVDEKGNVYVVGQFYRTFDERISAYNLAMWNGTEWSTFEDPTVYGNESFRVETIGDSVFVWGAIVNPDFGPIEQGGLSGSWGLVVYDGQDWQPIRTRLDQAITNLDVFKDELIIVHNNTVQRLTDSGLRSLDNPNSGLNGIVRDLAVDEGGNLYAVGAFNEAGGQPSVGVAKWNGQSWETYGSTFNGELTHISIANDKVYVATQGPYFPFATKVNGETIASVAVLEEGQWKAVPGFDSDDGLGFITDIEADGANLYVSGQLYGAPEVSGIAQWNGEEWKTLDGNYGFSIRVIDIEVEGNDLYVVGSFEKGPEAPANQIARWDGSFWHPIGNDDYPSSTIRQLEIQGDILYTQGYRWQNGVWEEYGIGGASLRVDGTSIYSGAGHILAEPIVVDENCTIDASDIKVFIDGKEGTLGSGSRVCNPSYVLWQHFPQWVYAIEIVEEGVYFGGEFSHLGGFPSNNIGFWKFDKSNNVSNQEEHPLAYSISFSSPYPNPSQGRVSATYTLPNSQEITIDIYNVLGQQIDTLIEGLQPAGTHEIHWEAGKIPAGVYFMKLTSSTQSLIQKMVVIR